MDFRRVFLTFVDTMLLGSSFYPTVSLAYLDYILGRQMINCARIVQ